MNTEEIWRDHHQILRVAVFSIFLLWVTPFLFGKYVDTSFPFIPEEDIPKELVGLVGSPEHGRTWCPSVSPYLRGMDLELHKTLEDENYLVGEPLIDSSYSVQSGGIWQPSECQSRYEVVIIVPYRNREKQLKLFLSYMHPFLQRQQLFYRIIVVEQIGEDLFNRARLLNIGFKEARRLGAPNYCLIFHDVDLLPQNDHNIYACLHRPRHMYSSLNSFRYHLPYRTLFGGAVALLTPHFLEVNGFSNAFYGWGGEDDDFEMRLEDKGLAFERFDRFVGRYFMMTHRKEKPSASRWRQLANRAQINASADGLSTLHYEIGRIILSKFYTHVYVK